MALRAKPPEVEASGRIKMLLYGLPGVGKTTTSIQFPKPYLIETERGTKFQEYVDLLNANGGSRWFSTDLNEITEEVKQLLGTKHDFRTLVIDPLTNAYNDDVDASARERGTDFGRHKVEPDRKARQLARLLERLDMNVIVTAHAKTKWKSVRDTSGKDTRVEDGITFDCYSKLDYIFDFVFEVERRGKDLFGIVRKTRDKRFMLGDSFVFSYKSIADRCGAAMLERESTPVVLASPEQIAEFLALIELRKDGDDLLAKMLKKYIADDPTEMGAEAIGSCIDFLKKGDKK